MNPSDPIAQNDEQVRIQEERSDQQLLFNMVSLQRMLGQSYSQNADLVRLLERAKEQNLELLEKMQELGAKRVEHVEIRGETMFVDLWYPDTENSKFRDIHISLIDVRAADDIKISYDKDRDGWLVEDFDEEEVAFIEGNISERNGQS